MDEDYFKRYLKIISSLLTKNNYFLEKVNTIVKGVLGSYLQSKMFKGFSLFFH